MRAFYKYAGRRRTIIRREKRRGEKKKEEDEEEKKKKHGINRLLLVGRRTSAIIENIIAALSAGAPSGFTRGAGPRVNGVLIVSEMSLTYRGTGWCRAVASVVVRVSPGQTGPLWPRRRRQDAFNRTLINRSRGHTRTHDRNNNNCNVYRTR